MNFEFHDIEQNSDVWADLHCGRLTSSNLAKVMANYPKAFGEPAKKLAVDLAIEQITGRSGFTSGYSNEHMERGHEQEPLARAMYEADMFCTVTNGGFFCNDFLGCSPDGLVNHDGLVEFKSVIASTHHANVCRQSVDPAYRWQCLANLKFTGRDWLDFVSFCADYPEDKQLFVYRLWAEDHQAEFAHIDDRTSQFRQLVDERRHGILNSEYIVLNHRRKAA